MTNADNDSTIYDLGTTRYLTATATAVHCTNAMQNIGSTLTTGWRERNSGSYVTSTIGLQRILAIDEFTDSRYQGGGLAPTTLAIDWCLILLFRLADDSANDDTWDGEWFAILKKRFHSTPTMERLRSSIQRGSGSLNGRIIGSRHTFNAVDANVENDLDESNNLDVIGSSTLATTSVGEFTSTDRVNVTINDITATPGGSETLSFRQQFHHIFGANGTYTINLPASEWGDFAI